MSDYELDDRVFDSEQMRTIFLLDFVSRPAVVFNFVVLWRMITYSPVGAYQPSRGICCLIL
jgi:hypothetical protein